jgi:hypothetical protein
MSGYVIKLTKPDGSERWLTITEENTLLRVWEKSKEDASKLDEDFARAQLSKLRDSEDLSQKGNKYSMHDA